MTAVRPRPIALVTHSYFDEDPRLRRQAEALVASGRPVDVIALRRPGEPAEALVGGVRVRRLSVQRHQGAGAARYLWEYLSFFARAAVQLLVDHGRRRYALVQVATLPDWLVFAALPLRLAGVPVVLDFHEAMPEFFGSRFPRLAHPLVHRLLVGVERASAGAATHDLMANEALRDRLVGLGVAADRVSVVPNVPSLARFDPATQPERAFMADGSLRLVYTGALTPTYELDVALRAVAEVRDRRPELGATLDLYGRGDSEAGLQGLATELGLESHVRWHGRIPIEAVPAAIAQADIGLAPVARTPFTQLSFSTKVLEYGAMRRPLVTARLPLADRLLGPEFIELYESGDPVGLADGILRIVDLVGARTDRVAAMAERVATLSWEHEQARYIALIDRLARPA